jgi:hypothetical protein
VRNAGTIPGVVLSAWGVLARAGQQGCWPAAVRPTPRLHLMWLAGEDPEHDEPLWRDVLAVDLIRRAGLAL